MFTNYYYKEKKSFSIGEVGEFKSTTDDFEPQIVLAFKKQRII
jgi:hypothetical protein